MDTDEHRSEKRNSSNLPFSVCAYLCSSVVTFFPHVRRQRRSRAKVDLLLGLAFFQQQVVSFNDDLVTGVKSVANFNPVAALDPRDYFALLVAATVRDEHNRFPAVVEHGRLRDRNRSAMLVSDYLHIGKHIWLQPAVRVWNLCADLHTSRLRVDHAVNQND